MIRITLQGGLGNQMFQYALGLALEARGRDVEYDLSRVHILGSDQPHNRYKPQYGLDGFHTCVRHATKIELPVYGTDQVGYDPNVLHMDNIQLSGYWQSEKYFTDFEVLDQEFMPLDPPSKQICEWVEEMKHPDAILFQVRRGDYLQFQSFHGVMDKEYFERAQRLVGGGIIYVITDDVAWCKEQWPTATIINTGSRHWDIRLMSECARIVISNSSFGWWGAWLGDNHFAPKERRVVAPGQWFATDKIDSSDVIPGRWTKT